jgi:hypothetical protein
VTRAQLRSAACACIALTVALAHAPVRGQSWDYAVQRIDVPRKRAGFAFGRLDRDERPDLVVADDARLILRLQTPQGALGEPLTFPLASELGGGALVQVAKLEADGPDEVIALHRSGVDRFQYDAPAGNLVRREPILTGQRGIPFLHLALEEFLYDMDEDGDLDLAFPVNGAVYVFVREGDAFVRRGEVKVDALRVTLEPGRAELDTEASARLQLPRVRIERRAAPGADAAGATFSYERRPDPLAQFKKRQGLEGEAAEKLQAQYTDIDGDGISDYLLVESNRIWVYRGSATGFDLDRSPDQLLKVSLPSAGVLSAALLPLDGDERPDLVLFKFTLPSVGRTLAALAVGINLEFEVLGYTYDGAPVFARQPAYRSTLALRIPPVLRLVAQVEELAERVESLQQRIGRIAAGDFDGDGEGDIARLEDQRVEVFTASSGSSGAVSDASEDRGGVLKELLFGRKRRDLTLEEAFKLLEDVLDRASAGLTVETPVATLAVPQDVASRVDAVAARDLNGDGRDDLILSLAPESAEAENSLRKAPETLLVFLSPPRSPAPETR